MRKIIKILKTVIIFAIIVLGVNKAYAAELSVNVSFDGEDIEMTSDTPEMMWTIENLLPGEKDETTLAINNIGKKQVDVVYTVDIENGKDLVDILNIKIVKISKEKEEQIFNGKYEDLKKFELKLNSDEKQVYKFYTSMPIEAGNEYQNKECEIKFKFLASGVNKNAEIITDVINPVQTGESYFIYAVFVILAIAIIALVVSFIKHKNNEK